jgi:hypothetical protein
VRYGGRCNEFGVGVGGGSGRNRAGAGTNEASTSAAGVSASAGGTSDVAGRGVGGFPPPNGVALKVNVYSHVTRMAGTPGSKPRFGGVLV